MIVTTSMVKAEQYAQSLEPESKMSHGINWTWISFKNKSNGELFIKYLDENNFEHRGIYANDPGCDIRFRD